FNLPEYWRARTPDDLKIIHALCTRGLPEAIAASTHLSMAAFASDGVEADEARARAAAAIYVLHQPAFFTLHLSSLDHEQHEHGPGSPEAIATLTRIDAAVGALVEAARRAEPDLVVVIVSDHGFAAIERDINLGEAFVEAGLITLNSAGQPTQW